MNQPPRHGFDKKAGYVVTTGGAGKHPADNIAEGE
ncbi:hypothetical protein H650_02200 [Enterobacter sp. R4-368]|nr:hypothetical protein H650_02200 [Enterobacter sp. R4-368]